MSTPRMNPLLRAEGITAGYGRSVVLHDVSVEILPGSVVAVLGPNGAGKTTFLRTLIGYIKPNRGKVMLDGADITGLEPNKRAKNGMCLIPEGRGIFRTLSVRDNLRLAVPPWAPKEDIEPAVSAFPVLGRRLRQLAGSLSGGEQQMLAVSRAYLSSPRLVLVDEVSMGLAPIVVDQIFESLNQLKARDVSLVIVEQYVHQALRLADRVYLMAQGSITWSGNADDLSESMLSQSYLGDSIEGVAASKSLEDG